MSVTFSPLGGFAAQFFDNNGVILSGGKVYTYSAGTTAPQATYTSVTGVTPHTNPIILDSAGRVPGGEIWLVDGASYKFIVQTSNSVLIGTYDNVSAIPSLNADVVEYDPPFSGALTVGYTVEDKLSQYVSVKDFGAVGDGVTDDTAAIQAAFDAFKNTGSVVPNRSKDIWFPEGEYLVDSLNVYGGLTLNGEGSRSRLVASGTGIGQILNFFPDGSGFCSEIIVQNLGFYSRGSVWAIKSTTGITLSCQFKNLQFDSTYCVNLDGYSQSCIIDTIFSFGPVEQIFRLQGNRNYIKNILKEGPSGTNSDPYIYVHSYGSPSAGNKFVDLLLEGAGSVNKTPIVFDGVSGNVTGCWIEFVNQTTGYYYDFTDTYLTMDASTSMNTSFGGKMKLTTSEIHFLDFDFAADDNLISEVIECDATSVVFLRNVRTRRDLGNYIIPKILKNFSFSNQQTATIVSGQSPYSSLRYTGGNVLINPSFEAGIYGWTISGAAGGTFDAIDSTFSTGKMLRLTNAGTAAKILSQNISISADQVGIPVTFTIAVRDVNGSGSTHLYSGGAGVTASTAIHRASGTEWQLLTGTLLPSVAGTLAVQILTSGSLVYFDAARAAFGKDAEIDQSSFGMLTIADKPFGFATAAPTAGTWPVGAIVKNSAPAVGQPKGWVCTVAGTPGTWVSEGNL